MAINSLTPTTELEAVNAMLAINGVSPIEQEDLDADPIERADVEMAVNLIRLVAKDVQSKGWHFNTDRLVTLTPTAGNIAVPSDALRVKKSRTEEQRDMDIAHRHGNLWDRVNNTATFSDPVQVDIVRALDFEDMPETARRYVFIVAGRRFQEQTIGNTELSGFGQKDEDTAYANLIDAEGLLEDTDYLENFPDQQMVNKVLRDVSRKVQSEGWKFNIRRNVEIEPNDDDELVLPENTLVAKKAATAAMARTVDMAHRGGLMYNVSEDTTTFDPEALPEGKAYLDLFVYLELDELPATALDYIKIKAGRQIQAQRNPTQPPAHGYTDQDEAEARRNLVNAEGLPEEFNIFRNMDVARAVFRPNAFPRGRLRPKLGQY
jgi:hypothetical protein